VKMKVGRDPAIDPRRVEKARAAIGPNTELFVDANGAYSRKQALNLAEKFANLDVSWFEEPVSSDDLEGLRLLRDRGPAGMDIAAGEYGYDAEYFRRMLSAGAFLTRFGKANGYRLLAAFHLAPFAAFSGAQCAMLLSTHSTGNPLSRCPPVFASGERVSLDLQIAEGSAS
jgi:Enolase C-terminal domain-like